MEIVAKHFFVIVNYGMMRWNELVRGLIMRKIYCNVIQFRGTHYDFGYYQGELLKNSIIVKNRERQWLVRKPRFHVPEQEVKQAITAVAPRIWEELCGLRDALGWPMERILMEFGGYRLNYVKSGCSILTGNDYLIRNYDYHPKTYDGRITVFQPSDSGYAVIGPSQRITGRMDGMNEHGLAMGYNFINRRKPGDGFICTMIGRLILELCRSADEAVQLLKEIPHRYSFSYIVYDRTNTTKIIETTPRNVVAREAVVCTNHFEIMTCENRRHLEDSKRRMAIIEERRPHLKDAKDAFRLFNDTDRGVFSKLYGSWAGTIHTSAYFPKDMKVWFALGGDREPVEFDFRKWLNGEDLQVDRIYGGVDTDIPFVHMDEDADWFQRK